MKFKLLSVFTFWVFISFIGFSQPPKGIDFQHVSFAELKAKAALEKKLIFVDAYTTWCGPCKWMAKNVFTTEDVGSYYNHHFINAKIDMEKGEGLELTKLFNVSFYPSLLYIDSEGAIVHRAVGSRDGKAFIELGKEALDPDQNLRGLAQKFKQDPSSFATAFRYITLLDAAELPEEKAVFETYIATQDRVKWVEPNNWRMLYSFVQNPKTPLFVYFKENRAQFSKRYTTDSVDAKLVEVYFNHLQRAAQGKDDSTWQKTKKAILDLNLPGADRHIASTTILRAEGDKELKMKRIIDFMNQFGSQNANELNEYSWAIFESSSDPKQLLFAESWAKTGIELTPEEPNIRDTYAQLLFKNKKTAEAKIQAEKAIALGEKSGNDMSGTKALLKEIDSLSKPEKARTKPNSHK